MKKTLLSIILAIFIKIAYPQITDTVKITTPGTLNLVAKNYLTTVTNLTITGTIDARDFKTMRDSMPVLAILNLSSANIAGYTGTSGTQDTISEIYSANAIPQYAFSKYRSYTGKTSLTSISLPNNITIVGISAFYGCYNLSGSFTIPSSVTLIGDFAYNQCFGYKGSLNIPSSVINIGTGAFAFCSGFTGKLIIPFSVISIGDYSFMDCVSFKDTLSISSSVTYIGSYAFYHCYGLTTIEELNPVPLTGNAMGGDSMFTGDKINNLSVLCGSINTYKAAPIWNSFNISTNDKVVSISANADTVHSGSSVTFTADTECIGQSVSLQWQVNNKNAGTGKNNFSYIPLNNDIITCLATFSDTTTMSNSIVMNVLPGTGINNLTGNNVTIYPNPVSGNLSISIDNPSSLTGIIIYNLNGIEVYSSNVNSSITEVDMKGFTPGIYIVKIISPESVILTSKVIKQ